MTPHSLDESQDTARIACTVVLLVTAAGSALLVESRLAALGILAVAAVLAATQPLRVLEWSLVALIILEVPLQADVYLGHDPAIAATGALSGFVLSFGTLALAILLAAWAAERAAGVDPVPATPLSRSSWALLAWVGFSALWASDPTRSLYEFWLIGQAVLLFAYLRNHLASDEGVRRMRFLLILALLGQGLLVITTELLGPITIGPIQTTLTAGRANGTFGSPNVLGSFFTMLLPLAFVGLRTGVGYATKSVAWAALALGSISLVLSSSRGAWVGSAVAMGAIVVVGALRRWFSRTTMVAMGLGALVAGVTFAGEIAARISAYDNAAAQARGPLNRLAFELVSDHLWIGVGANNFSLSSLSYLDVSYASAWISTVHNKYLLVWAELGVVGLALFAWFLWSVGSTGFRLAGKGTPFAPEAVAVSAGFAGTATHMLVDLFHGRVQYQLIWLLAALLAGIRNVRSRGAPANQILESDQR